MTLSIRGTEVPRLYAIVDRGGFPDQARLTRFAEELVRTPPQTEGPFYPDKLPLDTDNDLLIINDSITPAVGTVTHLSGRILDARGEPIKPGDGK